MIIEFQKKRPTSHFNFFNILKMHNWGDHMTHLLMYRVGREEHFVHYNVGKHNKYLQKSRKSAQTEDVHRKIFLKNGHG